jgi:peptide/nickel transport system permease protein
VSVPLALAARRFRAHPAALTSAAALAFLGLLAVFGPLFTALLGPDAGQVDLLDRLAPPSRAHPLGTDDLGRDVLLRLMEGARVSLAVGVLAALASAILGAALGILAGYYGGLIDDALMRLADILLALPLLPVLIVLTAVDSTKLGLPLAASGSGDLSRLVFLIAIFGWPSVARLVRGATLSLKARDFVRAAEALGASPARLMVRHILPNAASPLIVATTLSVGQVILFESVLSFLGLGIQPPRASWGNMLTGAQELVWTAPALVVYPGALIFVTVLAFNFLGDGLQDALDPRAGESGRTR